MMVMMMMAVVRMVAMVHHHHHHDEDGSGRREEGVIMMMMMAVVRMVRMVQHLAPPRIITIIMTRMVVAGGKNGVFGAPVPAGGPVSTVARPLPPQSSSSSSLSLLTSSSSSWHRCRHNFVIVIVKNIIFTILSLSLASSLS